MSEHRESVSLRLDDSFSGRMVAAREAAMELGNRMALTDATWEPHDWSAF